MRAWLFSGDEAVGLCPAIVFCALIAAEFCLPRRALIGILGQRWANNIGLHLLNSVIALWLMPAVAPWSMPTASADGWLGFLAAILILDLFSYALHRFLHAVPLLWRFHSVHHGDVDVDVTTAIRHHPLEFLLISGAIACLAGLLGFSVRTIATYGAIALAAQMTQHANVRIPERTDWFLRRLLVTPTLHRIHHSCDRRDADTNFGAVLSLWDQLFGSYRPSASSGGEPVAFGVSELTASRYQRFHWMLLTPLR